MPIGSSIFKIFIYKVDWLILYCYSHARIFHSYRDVSIRSCLWRAFVRGLRLFGRPRPSPSVTPTLLCAVSFRGSPRFIRLLRQVRETFDLFIPGSSRGETRIYQSSYIWLNQGAILFVDERYSLAFFKTPSLCDFRIPLGHNKSDVEWEGKSMCLDSRYGLFTFGLGSFYHCIHVKWVFIGGSRVVRIRPLKGFVDYKFITHLRCLKVLY